MSGSDGRVGTKGSRAALRKGELTRRRLLDAAGPVFAELGYHDASIVKITETAGVAQGTFYIYFENKQQVFEELMSVIGRMPGAPKAWQGTTKRRTE